MVKRPSLSAMARKKPGTTQDVSPSPSARAVVAGEEQGKKADQAAMTLRMPKATLKALKMRAIDEETTVTAIVLRAIQRELGQA